MAKTNKPGPFGTYIVRNVRKLVFDAGDTAATLQEAAFQIALVHLSQHIALHWLQDTGFTLAERMKIWPTPWSAEQACVFLLANRCKVHTRRYNNAIDRWWDAADGSFLSREIPERGFAVFTEKLKKLWRLQSLRNLGDFLAVATAIRAREFGCTINSVDVEYLMAPQDAAGPGNNGSVHTADRPPVPQPVGDPGESEDGEKATSQRDAQSGTTISTMTTQAAEPWRMPETVDAVRPLPQQPTHSMQGRPHAIAIHALEYPSGRNRRAAGRQSCFSLLELSQVDKWAEEAQYKTFEAPSQTATHTQPVQFEDFENLPMDDDPVDLGELHEEAWREEASLEGEGIQEPDDVITQFLRAHPV